MTGAPDRNFDLSADTRVRALMAGPPAFTRRLRAIEDLERAIVRALAGNAEATRSDQDEEARHRRDFFIASNHRRLRELVTLHNRYYPIEANLPICLRSGELLDRDGAPWRPRRCPSVEDLRAR